MAIICINIMKNVLFTLLNFLFCYGRLLLNLFLLLYISIAYIFIIALVVFLNN